MAFTTAGLASNGHTAHYDINYDDSLGQAGFDLANGLMGHCEEDFTLMSSWFPGVNFRFAFPIAVQIAPVGAFTGAMWVDPPDGFDPTWHPNVLIEIPATATLGQVRYHLVSEVTEMLMASASRSGMSWYEPTSWWSGGDEGSLGESLPRFLGIQFLRATGVSPVVYPGFGVVPLWLNAAGRPGLDFVDAAPDDINPDAITGCGTCFLFFLQDQLKFSIQQIIAAASSSLAGVYTNLTGKTDAWTAFHTLVDSHYPLAGGVYVPPLETVFPVADLQILHAPQQVSWVQNGGGPNFAWLFLNHPLPVNVKVTLSSDDPTKLVVPASVTTTSFVRIPLTVPPQAANFNDTPVKLTATYAGVSLTATVDVVRPENLNVSPLEIVPVPGGAPCAQLFVEGQSQQFSVKSLSVFADQTGLTNRWKVSGAHAAVTTDPVLSIPHLPAKGTKVAVSVDVTNASNIRAKGEYTFTVSKRATGKQEQYRQLDCSLQNLRAINLYIPPWVPNEAGEVQLTVKQLASIRDQAQRFATAAKRVIAAVDAAEVVNDAGEQRASAGPRLNAQRLRVG